MGKFNIRQIANLGKLFGFLIGELELPLHFLKVLNFSDLSKPQQLFLQVMFDYIYDEFSKDQVKKLF